MLGPSEAAQGLRWRAMREQRCGRSFREAPLACKRQTSERASESGRASVSEMKVDNRFLIKQIEARPALWNRDDKDYCHKQTISKLWTEIAVIHGVHASKVKTRWKTLRDTFRQELKKNPQQSPWRYYPDMQFLRGQMKLLPAAPEQEEDSEDLVTVKMEQQEAIGPNEKGHQDPLGLPEEPSTGPDSNGVVEATTFNDDDDYDHHFLLSLLPEMRRLQPKQKLLLRIKMLELLCKEVHD